MHWIGSSAKKRLSGLKSGASQRRPDVQVEAENEQVSSL